MLKIYRVSKGAASPHPLAVADVAWQLRAGALALLPTETVYGIGVAVGAYADAVAGDAVPRPPARNDSGCPAPAALAEGSRPGPAPGTGYARIFTLKHREPTQTVPWLVEGPRALDVYGVDVDPRIRALAERFWPGALTLIVKAAPGVPGFLQAADGTVALRASASPVIQALVRACGSPLAVTSANTHGAPAPASFDEVERRILQGVDVAVDAGATPCRDASTIVSCQGGGPRILRQGALSRGDILSALGARPEAGPLSGR